MASCQFMLIAGAHASLATWVAYRSVPRVAPVGPRAGSGAAARSRVVRVRGIRTVIPEPADQAGHRTRRGRRGGRPVRHDPVTYCGRNVIERAFNRFNNWRALATRYDKHATIYRRGPVVASLLSGYAIERGALVAWATPASRQIRSSASPKRGDKTHLGRLHGSNGGFLGEEATGRGRLRLM